MSQCFGTVPGPRGVIDSAHNDGSATKLTFARGRWRPRGVVRWHSGRVEVSDGVAVIDLCLRRASCSSGGRWSIADLAACQVEELFI